jgi:ribosomal protein S18 acetylase RimI-like enzyme
MEKIDFRILTAADASAYWKIRLEALEGDPEAFSSSAEDHRLLTVKDVAARLVPSDPLNNFVVGAFAGDQLIGTAGFYRDKGRKSQHKGHVWGVYITREARSSGVGRKMMRALLDRASRLEGVEQIVLSFAVSQIAALKLYRAMGFESFGREPRALRVGDRYIDEEFMILFVKRPQA